MALATATALPAEWSPMLVGDLDQGREHARRAACRPDGPHMHSASRHTLLPAGGGGTSRRSWVAGRARRASWASCCRALASCWCPAMRPHRCARVECCPQLAHAHRMGVPGTVSGKYHTRWCPALLLPRSECWRCGRHIWCIVRDVHAASFWHPLCKIRIIQHGERARPGNERAVVYDSMFGAQLFSRVAQVDALYADFGDALREERYALAAKEGIRANAAWLARNAAPLCAWLGAA